MMGKRKLFLLFLSAMSVSIIIMVIIYGLFIKDIDFNPGVKNPESAPTPLDNLTRTDEDSPQDNNAVEEDADKVPAHVETPTEVGSGNTNTNATPVEKIEDRKLGRDKPVQPEKDPVDMLPEPQAPPDALPPMDPDVVNPPPPPPPANRAPLPQQPGNSNGGDF